VLNYDKRTLVEDRNKDQQKKKEGDVNLFRYNQVA